ncbi:MAG: response regulator transcription factor [Rubrobacter sp.]|nr:response regulator transcription factor [Rubrobacter sp.]
MEHRANEGRGQTQDDIREQDPGRPGAASDDPRFVEDNRSAKAAASPNAGVQGSIPGRDVASWVNWQSALYLFVLGLVCVLLVPLTSLWWLVLVCGTAVPIVLATLDGTGLIARRPDDKKAKERELLGVLAERGELTPTTAAMRTSLTVNEASKMLEELARKGHLKLRAEDGVMAYALGERDRRETPVDVSAPSEAETESAGATRRLGAAQQLDDPLSEREIEVLRLLASGRTNSEVARDLFISIGTIKSHTGNIYRKLDAHNRSEALARARELGVLP